MSTPPSPERLDRTKAFWNAKAERELHVAIYDTPAVRDPETRQAAFDAAGLEDARDVAWFVHPGMRVVDLGCGVGRVLRPLAPLCREVVGVDVSESMLAEAAEYLAGLDNVRLIPTQGSTLPGIEDGSVDFLYSLLCLIHVDRRSAYLYMGEIARVLRPGGTCLLQFQNILSPEGLAKFQGVVDSDYPLEFYTEAELRALLASHGLGTLHVEAQAEYLYVTALAGDPAEWQRALATGVRFADFELEGCLAGAGGDTGELRARVRSELPAPQSFRATLSLAPAGEDAAPTLLAEATVVLEPGRDQALVFRVRADGLDVLLDDVPKAPSRLRQGPLPTAGPLVLNGGLLPPGYQWRAETLETFPNLCLSRRIERS